MGERPHIRSVRRRTKWVLGGLGGAVLVAGSAFQLSRHRYEEPTFSLVEGDGPLQIRRYEEKIVAETVVEGRSEKEATAEGFRRLAGYIFGGNGGDQSIAMTTPVERRAAAEGTSIAMTTPVEQTPRDGAWVIAFTMPSEYTLETLPQPNDARVQLRTVPGELVASLRFGGRANEDARQARTEELERRLADAGYRPVGEPTLAQFDPPWVLGFLRRNEIHVPVEPRG